MRTILIIFITLVLSCSITNCTDGSNSIRNLEFNKKCVNGHIYLVVYNPGNYNEMVIDLDDNGKPIKCFKMKEDEE